MINFRNIQPKDNSDKTKFKTISAIKKELDLTATDAKELYYKILQLKEVIYNGVRYDAFKDYDQYILSSIISEYFNSIKEFDQDENQYNQYIATPNSETAEALVWYESLSDEDKRKVDLITIWKMPKAIG